MEIFTTMQGVDTLYHLQILVCTTTLIDFNLSSITFLHPFSKCMVPNFIFLHSRFKLYYHSSTLPFTTQPITIFYFSFYFKRYLLLFCFTTQPITNAALNINYFQSKTIKFSVLFNQT